MAPSPTIRRLLKETKELSAAAAHPNPAFHAAPISDTNLHEWHFTLLGPPAPSPYASGIYHGRITLPPAYPMKPPNFRFLTPSGRFEVNREICLSISGFHEETWQPAWGVRTALVALRGFMSEERTAGQVGGLESTKEVRERLAEESRGWSCPACGSDEDETDGNKKGWSNEERLNWWWEICRAKGVNVEVECGGMEALPDGMKVETRDVKQIEDKSKHKEIGSPEEAASKNGPVVISMDRNTSTSPQAQPPVPLEPTSYTQGLPPQARPSAVDVPKSPPESTSQPQQMQMQRQITVPLQHNDRQTDSPITIDRAITVIVLALFITILKKMFYPSSSGVFGYDDLKLVRE